MACANIVNLLLARASGRRVEMALRAALGAGRGRLIRQLLTESLLAALAGGIAGVAIAYGITGVISHLATTELPRADEIGPDITMLIWGLLVSAFAGLLFGLLPAWQASWLDLQQAFRGASTSSQGREKHNFLAALIIAEIALAFILVLGVGLLGKSYLQLIEVNPGYDPRHVLTLSPLPDWNRYDTDEKRLSYYAAVAERMKTIPGVLTVMPALWLSVIPKPGGSTSANSLWSRLASLPASTHTLCRPTISLRWRFLCCAAACWKNRTSGVARR